MANLLTAVRLLLVIPFGVLMARADARAAALGAVVFMVAVASDLLDGRVARRLNTASPFGRAFDHSSDFLFVVSGLAGGATRGVFPWILPAVITLAFTQYVVDSYWLHRERQLRGSRLGRYNGILYFVPLGGELLLRLGLGFVQPLLPLIAWALVISTCLSIVDRLTSAIKRTHAA